MKVHRHTRVFVGLIAAITLAMPAHARREITPYLEVGQVLSADLKGANKLCSSASLNRVLNILS